MEKSPGCSRSGPERIWGSRICLVLVAILFASANGWTQERSERDVKALFFVALARYAEWPEGAFDSESSPLVIGVLGADPFGERLDSLTAKEDVRGRALTVQRYASAEEISDCHLLFVGRMSAIRMELEIARLGRRPILTVSDTDQFIERGGMVELFLNDEQKVRLRVAKKAVENAGIKMSPGLMKLAQVVASIEFVPSRLPNWLSNRDEEIDSLLHPVSARQLLLASGSPN